MNPVMNRVGIDAISLYTPRYVLHLEDLAQSRGIDPLKYQVGLGQTSMSVLPPNEDIVTMGAAAAKPILEKCKRPPSLLLFATESGIDHSKAAGIWVHKLLNLPSSCRVLELKQACYSATGALQLAIPYIQSHPDETVLIIASDNARYGIKTAGEPTQGCGSCAILIQSNPRLLALESGSGLYTDHVMDFWRPNYLDTALVDGKFSTKVYLTALENCWNEYTNKTGRAFHDHARFCYHLPFCKMAEKAHERLIKQNGIGENTSPLHHALTYTKHIGNSYSASLYFGLASLLENEPEDLSDQRIGFFSYGSGCVAEFFSGIVQPGYKDSLRMEEHKALFDSRQRISCSEYEQFFTDCGKHNSEDFTPSDYLSGPFSIDSLKQHIRYYKKANDSE